MLWSLLCVLCSISRDQSEDLPGWKIASPQLWRCSRDNSIVGFVLTESNPWNMTCAIPLWAQGQGATGITASLHTLWKHLRRISQFFSGAIACKIRRQAWKKSGWWWDTTDRIPFPPPEEKVGRETVTWMQRVPTIPSLLCDYWYPCILMRKGGEILSKYIVIVTVRLRTGLIGSLTNIQTRWAIFWQAFKLDGQWFAILEGGAVEQQEVASKCCLHQNQEKASYPPTHQR